MSGDVQPRKRKDKRRKKADGDYHIQRIRGTSFDEDDVGTPPPTLVNPSSENSTDNVTIHVHKEDGTGGHWCARIIFFALLSVLVGLVGIIIFEHRGITDVDTPISDSRWAMIFDGWVDDIIPQHDEEPHEEASEENAEHDEEETEEDEKGDHEEEEEEEEDETEENVADKDSPEVDKGEDEGIGPEEEEEEDEEEAEEEEEEDGSEREGHAEEEDQQSVEEEMFQKNAYASRREATRNERSYESREEKMIENDEGFDEDNSVENGEDFGTLEELENVSDEDTNEDETLYDSEENEGEDENDDDEREQDEDEEDREKEEADNMDNDLDVSIEGVTASRENDEEDDVSQEYFSIPGVGEIDDNSVEPLEEIEESDLEEVANELEIEPDEEQEIEEETSSVAVKFGVGVALIVAAHFVLVRRWKNVEADLTGGSYSNEAVDLARRNTIVPPLNPKNLISKNEDQSAMRDEKIAETYEQLGEKYRSLVTESPKGTSKGELGNPLLRRVAMQEKVVREGTSAKISKKEEETEETMTSESERQSATEAEEEDEEASEEEEEEENEDEELDDEEIEEPDDSELVAKLDAKYGKLPTPTESEDEDDYEEEDEEDEDDEEEPEEEDAEIHGWKRVKAPKGPRSGGPAVEQRRDVREKGQTQKGSSGSQDKNVHGSVNDSSLDEVSIQEEITNWLSKEFDN